MNKRKKKLRLNVETIRRLSPEALGEAVGGALSDSCGDLCTQATRCFASCLCQPTVRKC